MSSCELRVLKMSILKLSRRLPIYARVTPPFADFSTLEKVSLGCARVHDVTRELI